MAIRADANASAPPDQQTVEVEVAIRLVAARAAPAIVVAGLTAAADVAAGLAAFADVSHVRLDVLDEDQPSGAIRVTPLA